jgi:hypothetical protein
MCTIEYSGYKDAIHRLSKEISCGYEIGWEFVHLVKTSKASFTCFVNNMTRRYRATCANSPAFMSVKTFVKWFFSWIAGMRINFRTEIDPWCGHNPKHLAGDGTHVGVNLRYFVKSNLEDNDLNQIVAPLHKRSDRMFLPSKSNSDLRKCRDHLKWI